MTIATSASTRADEASRSRRGRPGYDRRQVLAVAVDLFNEKGYDATSVADLAAGLGLTKSALYHHFPSKEHVLEQALNVALTALEDVLDDPAAEADSAAAQLSHVIRGAVVVLVEKLPYVTLLLRVRGNSEVETRALERRRVFDQRVTAVVDRAQTEGLLRPDIDPAVATRLVFGMVNSLTEWYRPGGPLDADEIAATVLATALDGLQVARSAS